MCGPSAQSDSLSAQEAGPWPVAGGREGGLSPEATIVEGGKKRGNRKDIDAVLGALRSIAAIDDHPSPEPGKPEAVLSPPDPTGQHWGQAGGARARGHPSGTSLSCHRPGTGGERKASGPRESFPRAALVLSS